MIHCETRIDLRKSHTIPYQKNNIGRLVMHFHWQFLFFVQFPEDLSVY